MSPSETLYWGFKLLDWATLAALVLGPVIAVLFSNSSEERRRKREPKILIARTLFMTRNLPADASYSQAITLIPFIFEGREKVIAAWQAFQEAANVVATTENEIVAGANTKSKQTALIVAINHDLGLRMPQEAVETGAYTSGGFIARDNLYLGSLSAMSQIADTLKRQLELMERTYQKSPIVDNTD